MLWQKIAYAARRTRERGILDTTRVALRAATEYALPIKRSQFDRLRNVETDGKMSIRGLSTAGGNAADATPYHPSDEQRFRRHVDLLGIDCGQFAFVDVGCGKGRVLILAAERGFRRIVGVEFARELAEAALRNVRRIGCTVEVVWQDAAQYSFPAGSLVVYFYNPFGAGLVSQITARLAASPDYVILIYENPVHVASVNPGFKSMREADGCFIASNAGEN